MTQSLMISLIFQDFITILTCCNWPNDPLLLPYCTVVCPPIGCFKGLIKTPNRPNNCFNDEF